MIDSLFKVCLILTAITLHKKILKINKLNLDNLLSVTQPLHKTKSHASNIHSNKPLIIFLIVLNRNRLKLQD